MTPVRNELSTRNVLLDTHALLWLVSDPGAMWSEAVEVLSDRSCGLWVSAASAWEIAIKTRLGRLDGEPLLTAWSAIMADLAATELAMDADDAILAGRLKWDNRDPFDRMLVAQATRRNLTLATRDEKIVHAAPVVTLTV